MFFFLKCNQLWLVGLCFLPCLAFGKSLDLSDPELPIPYKISQTHPYWYNLGVGVGNMSEVRNGFEADVSVNYAMTQDQFLSTRATGISSTKKFVPQAIGFATTAGMPHTNDMVGGAADMGLLYGLRSVHDWGYVSGSTGVAYVDGSKMPTAPNTLGQGISTVGLPLEAEVFYDVNNHLGISVIGFADVNSEASFVGITLATQMGNF